MFTASELKQISDDSKLGIEQLMSELGTAASRGENQVEIKSCRIKDIDKVKQQLMELGYGLADMPYDLRIVFNK